MWRRDCYKLHYKSPFGSLTGEVCGSTGAHDVPQQWLKHIEISLQSLIPQQPAKKKSPQNKFTAKCKYSLQQCLPKCWCSCSLSPSGTRATVREAGTWTWIFREGFHLQVLLLSGEGVGEALHCLRFVFCYFWLDGLCDFLNHRINLFQEAMGLVDLIHLRGQREKMTKPVKLYYFLVIHRSE